jgi:hypothetical protein
MARDLFEEAGIAPEKASGGRDLFKEAGVETKPTLSNFVSPVDLAIAGGSRMLTSPLSPLSGLAGILGTVLPGPKEQGANWVRGVQGLQESLTYQPRTTVGQGVLDAIRYPFQKLSEYGESEGEKAYNYSPGPQKPGATSPEFNGALTESVIKGLPSVVLPPFLSRGVGAVAEASTAARSRNAVRDATLREAKDAGYVLPPSATAGRNFITDLMESLGGKAALKQEAINRNQPVTNRLAVQEAGLPANTAMTPEILAAKRKEAAAPYREAAAIDKAVAEDVEALQTARLDLKDSAKKYFGPNGGPEERRAFDAAKQKVTALEQQIEDAAKNAGIPGLVDRIRAARTQIAKIHQIEEGLNRGTADVSARPIGAAYADGSPLTGGLKTIGATQNAYPGLLGDAAGNPAPGVHNLRVLAAPVMGLEGAAHGGAAGAAIGGLPLLGGVARSMLLSGPSQTLFARSPLYLGSRIPMQVADPALRAILASELMPRGVLTQDQQ